MASLEATCSAVDVREWKLYEVTQTRREQLIGTWQMAPGPGEVRRVAEDCGSGRYRLRSFLEADGSPGPSASFKVEAAAASPDAEVSATRALVELARTHTDLASRMVESSERSMRDALRMVDQLRSEVTELKVDMAQNQDAAGQVIEAVALVAQEHPDILQAAMSNVGVLVGRLANGRRPKVPGAAD